MHVRVETPRLDQAIASKSDTRNPLREKHSGYPSPARCRNRPKITEEELRQVKKDSLDYRGRHRASAKRPAPFCKQRLEPRAVRGSSETGNLGRQYPY